MQGEHITGGAGGLPTHVHMSGTGALRRAEAEHFVYRCFERHYGARIGHFMPLLMGLSSGDGELGAVLGLRPAGDEPLFLETYLERPVEEVLGQRVGAAVARERIMEVGNLAVSHPGGGRWLITALTAYLTTTPFEWVVFTIGPALQNAFTRLGLRLVDLGAADPAALPARERRDWGSYYDQRPRVMAGRIAEGHAALRALCEQETALMSIWLNAVAAGFRPA